MDEIRELTNAEEEVMQVLWDLERCFLKDIVDHFPEPKPAYNTISTIVRILDTKGFIGHKVYGRTHEYFALISKDEYRAFATQKLMKGYFQDSVEEVLSFFVKEKKLNTNDLNEILKTIKGME